ncbi:MAG: hypothetical protein AB7K24_13750 [Gemmataceae bacterium]
MRAQVRMLLAAALFLSVGALPVAAQNTLQGGFQPVQVKFQPIDMSRLSAPIPPFPGAQQTGGLGALALFGRNTPGFAQTVNNGFPQTAPTPVPAKGGLFGLRETLKNVVPGFFRRSQNSPSAAAIAPQTQGPINLGVFQPQKPFVPNAN